MVRRHRLRVADERYVYFLLLRFISLAVSSSTVHFLSSLFMAFARVRVWVPTCHLQSRRKLIDHHVQVVGAALAGLP